MRALSLAVESVSVQGRTCKDTCVPTKAKTFQRATSNPYNIPDPTRLTPAAAFKQTQLSPSNSR